MVPGSTPYFKYGTFDHSVIYPASDLTYKAAGSIREIRD